MISNLQTMQATLNNQDSSILAMQATHIEIRESIASINKAVEYTDGIASETKKLVHNLEQRKLNCDYFESTIA